MTDHDLRLHEELTLLALKDDRGTPRASAYIHGVAGGVMAELMLEGRVDLEERRRRKPRARVASATQIGDPVLDDALRAVHTAKRPATVETWVHRWARTATLHATARRLSWKGILRTEERRVLLVFTRTVYPELDPAPERRLVEWLRTAIFGGDDVDARTALLVVLADAAELLRPLFGRGELRPRKDRIEALGAGEMLDDGARVTVQAVRSAVVASVTAARAAAVS